MKQHELELLADYVGGALDGTPEAAEVTRLVREDAAWATAHAELTAALRQVDADLATAARTAEEMPEDVWSRLADALSSPAPTPAPAPAAVAPPPVEQPVWVPPARRQPVPVAAGRPMPRLLRWLAPVGIAAAVLGVAGVGAQLLRPGSAADEAAVDMDKGGPQPALGTASTGVVRLETGRDYTAKTLALLTDDSVIADATRKATTLSGIDGDLTRFRDQAVLASCLEAISRLLPGSVTVVDLARYQGNPAVMVVVAKADGGKWVGVAGSECGRGHADLQEQRTFD